MKVIHVASEIGGGGAARSALNLHLGLLQKGVCSKIYCGEVYGEVPKEVVKIPSIVNAEKEFQELNNLLVWSNRSDVSNTHFSLNFPGWDPSACDLLLEADVINLHWVAGCLSASSVMALSALGKPLVWTLHDMRPFTGGCHFPAGCEGFTDGCRECPQLLDDLNGLVSKSKALIVRAIEQTNIHLVAPSSWMLERAKKATPLLENKISFIPYGVDVEHFNQGEKLQARKKLGLDNDAFYVLLAANNSREKRKGFSEAISILASLEALPGISQLVKSGNLRILVCGHEANDVSIKRWQVDCAGYLDYLAMPLAYQAADLLLFTSLEDNLPNVVMEALSCGLPVVGHDLAGVRDLVGNDEKCLFPIGETGLACSIIKKLIHDESARSLMGERGRKRIKEIFSIQHQAGAYLELYRKLTEEPLTYRKGKSVTREEEYSVLIEALKSTVLLYKYISKERKSLLYRIKNFNSELKWWCSHLYKQFLLISFHKKNKPPNIIYK